LILCKTLFLPISLVSIVKSNSYTNQLLREYEAEVKKKTSRLKWQRNGWFLSFTMAAVWAVGK
jgi:hypothetical protein